MLPIKLNEAEDQGPEVGVWEAAYELAGLDTFVTGVARDESLQALDGDAWGGHTPKRLSPEELNAKYKDVELPFDKPMSETAAAFLNDEGRKRKELQQSISNGPHGAFYNQAIGMAASIAAHAMDPVETGVGILSGFAVRGIGAIAKSGQLGTKLIKPGEVLAKGGYTAEVVEGIGGNLALEPILAAQSERARMDYTLEDSFYNVVGGGIAAPSFFFGVRKAFSMMSDSAAGVAVKTSLAQFTEGKLPTAVDTFHNGYEAHIYANPAQGAQLGEVRSSYKFTPMAETKGKTFYVSPKGNDLASGSKKIGSFFGESIIDMTDNPNFANNLSAHPMDDVNTDVIEVSMDDVKLLDADDKEILKSLDIPEEVKGNLDDGMSIKEAFEKVASEGPEAEKRFLDSLVAAGYDGISESDVKRGHNAVHLFPESASKLQEQAKYKPDVKAVPQPDSKRIEAARQASQAKEMELEYDVKASKEFEEFVLPDDVKGFDESKMAAELDEDLQGYAAREKEGLVSPASKELLETVKSSKAKRKSKVDIVKDYVNCLYSGAAS
jgi:hypothetical protein